MFSGHNQRCTDLPTSPHTVNSGEYLIEVNNLSELMSFSRGASLPLLYSDLCNNNSNKSYYFGSLIAMATNMYPEKKHEKSESVVFFGPRGQTLMNRSAVSVIIDSIKVLKSLSNKNVVCP